MNFDDLVGGLWADEAWEADGLDDERQKSYAEFLDQGLSQPLVDTVLLKYSVLIHNDDCARARLRSTCSYSKERHMVDLVNRKFPKSEREWVPYTPGFLVDIVNTAISCPDESLMTPPLDVASSLSGTLARALSEVTPTAPLVPTQVSELTRRYYTAHVASRQKLDKLRACYASGDGSPKWAQLWSGDLLISSTSFCFVEPATITYGSFDMFMCIVDVLRLRYTTHLAADCVRKPGLTAARIEDQHQWQFKVLATYGNGGYDLVKAPEAMWKCWVSRLAGGSYASPDAYDRMVEKQSQKERELSGGATPLIDEFVAWQATISSVDVAVELFGIIKNSGFPVIDPRAGSGSARDYATRSDYSQPPAMLDSWRTLRHLILINYLRQHGCWPPMTFRRKRLELERLKASNILSITDQAYPLEEWDHADIGQIFDFDYHEDYLELMDDRACSPPRSLVMKFYKGGRNVERWWRRILQVMLRTPKVDTRALISRFSQGLLTDEEHSILVRPKEKEFKLAARMYCMMTFSVRLIFSIVQENVKKQLFRYMPYQSMTMDSVALTQKLLAMTHQSAKSETLFIEVDLTRWNLCFRDVLLRGYGRALDLLFGVSNVFGRANETFWRCQITNLVTDQRIPAFESGGVPGSSDDMHWTGHEGGFEGIDQATMTLATIVMIYRALRGEDCTFVLLGQGDNQTLAITRNSNIESMGSFSDRVMRKIELSCQQLNHIAKPEEFVDSTKVLTYSKVFIVAGRIVPMELKHLAGVAPITASDVPCVGDALGAIFSAASGAGQNSLDPLRLWGMALIVFQDTIERLQSGGGWIGAELKNSSIRRLGPIGKKLAAIVPSVLGGFPLTGWTAFVARNEPDPLTAAIAGLRYLAPYDTDIQRLVTYLLTDAPYRTRDIDLGRLIKDPYSLPFRNPPTQQGYLERAAESTLHSTTVNRDIREVLTMSRVDGPQLLIALKSMRPFFPTLAHDLWKLSVPGVAEAMSKKFTLTRTMVSESHQARAGLNYQLIDAEVSSCNAVVLRLIESTKVSPAIPAKHITSFSLAEKLRERWGVGPNLIQGVSTAHPLDYVVTTSDERAYGVRCVSVGSYDACQTDRGPLKPFLGAKTMERRVGKTYEIKRAPNVLELQKLVSLVTSGGIGASMRSLVDQVVKTRTSIPLSTLEELYPKTIGGIIAHRYEMLGAETAMAPVGNPNLQTYLVFNSDDVPGVSGSKVDYPIAFQQFYSYLVFFQRRVMLDNPKTTSRTVTIQLKAEGLPELTQEVIEAEPVALSPPTPDLQANQLVWIPALQYKAKARDMDRMLGRKLELTQGWIEHLPNRRRLLVSLIIAESSRRAPSGIRLDEEELGGKPPYKIDAVAFDALGAEELVTASIRAVQVMTIVTYMSEAPAPQETRRHSIVGLVEKWTDIVTDLWAHHLPRRGAQVQYLRDRGLLATGASQNRNRVLKAPVSRFILSQVVRELKDRRSMLIIDDYIGILREPAGALGTVLSQRLALAIWKIVQHGGRSSLTDLYRLAHNSTMRRDSAAPPKDYLIRLYSTAVSKELMFKTPPRLLRVANRLNQYLTDRYEMVNLHPEEVWRLFRHLPERDIPYGKTAPFRYLLPPRIQPQATQMTIVGNVIVQALPDYLPEYEKWDTRGLLLQRAGKIGGLHSTAGNMWYHALEGPLKGPILVIGTGGGGIQALLASRGIPSVGTDHQEVLQYGTIGSLNHVPAEVARFDSALGQLLPQSELGSKDFLHSATLRDLLLKQHFNGIIVDVEVPRLRPAMVGFRAIIESGYLGHAWCSVRGTRQEIEVILSTLNGSPGIITKGIHMLSIGSIADDGPHMVAIHFEVRGGANLLCEVDRRVVLTALARRQWPRSAIRKRDFEDQLNDLSGGYTNGVAGSLATKLRHLRRLADDGAGVNRGRLSSSALVAVTVSIGLYQILQRVLSATDREVRLRIVSDALTGSEAVKVRGRTHLVDDENNGYVRGIVRHIARYL